MRAPTCVRHYHECAYGDSNLRSGRAVTGLGFSRAKLVYVTPSHQFPLGVVLSLPKRLQLLDWAARNDAWILEDDFDSEYRYESKPIPALQGLDRTGVLFTSALSVRFFSLHSAWAI